MSDRMRYEKRQQRKRSDVSTEIAERKCSKETENQNINESGAFFFSEQAAQMGC